MNVTIEQLLEAELKNGVRNNENENWPSISFAITAHNEARELEFLLHTLFKTFIVTDEIVILLDNPTDEVKKVCKKFDINPYYHDLNMNFAEHKNYLNSLCNREYIFQLDADEVPTYSLISVLRDFIAEIKKNEDKTLEAVFIPRINIVEGISEEYVKKMNWRLVDGVINYPDYQQRFYINNGRVKWTNDVHEVLTNYHSYFRIPAEAALEAGAVLWHKNKFEKQNEQNEFYERIKQNRRQNKKFSV